MKKKVLERTKADLTLSGALVQKLELNNKIKKILQNDGIGSFTNVNT